MCSRFENKDNGISIFKRLNKNSAGEYILEEFEETKKVNIAPTDRIIVLMKQEHKIKITEARWGIKFKEEKTSPLIFNSRIETIIEKSFWKNLFFNNRCLLPATAFYEWKTENNEKKPYKITLEKNSLFYFSAIYKIIDNKLMVSMITTEPNLFMKNIHKRMPNINLEGDIFRFFNDDSEKLINEIKPLDNKVQMNMEEF